MESHNRFVLGLRSMYGMHSDMVLRAVSMLFYFLLTATLMLLLPTPSYRWRNRGMRKQSTLLGYFPPYARAHLAKRTKRQLWGSNTKFSEANRILKRQYPFKYFSKPFSVSCGYFRAIKIIMTQPTNDCFPLYNPLLCGLRPPVQYPWGWIGLWGSICLDKQSSFQKKGQHVQSENVLFKGKFHCVESTSNLGFIRASTDMMRESANDKNVGLEILGMNYGVSWVGKQIHFFGPGFLCAVSIRLCEWIQSPVLHVDYLCSVLQRKLNSKDKHFYWPLRYFLTYTMLGDFNFGLGREEKPELTEQKLERNPEWLIHG